MKQQRRWWRRHGSLWKPRLWLKGFLYQLDKAFLGRSPIEYKDRQQQTRCLRQASSLAVALTDNNEQRKRKKYTECRAGTDLGRQIKISYSHRSHASCFIHRLFWDSANVGWIFVLRRAKFTTWGTSSHEEFRCESPIDSNTRVRTLSSLKYAFLERFHPTWSCTPPPPTPPPSL